MQSQSHYAILCNRTLAYKHVLPASTVIRENACVCSIRLFSQDRKGLQALCHSMQRQQEAQVLQHIADIALKSFAVIAMPSCLDLASGVRLA